MPMKTRGVKRDYRKLAGLPPAKTMKITRKVRVKPLAPTTQASVAQIVKRQIARKTENKMKGKLLEDAVFHNSSITAGDVKSILPAIQTGTLSYQRIGDKIQPKSLVVRGVLACSTETPTNQPILVRVMILQQKSLRATKDVDAGLVQTAQLLRPNILGAPNDQEAYQGRTQDIMKPINTDLFRVYYDKTFLLAPVVNSATGTNAIEQNPSCVRRWGYRFRKLPTGLSYDELSQDLPNNFAPFFTIGYAFADGTNPDSVSTRLVSSTQSYLTYEDA